MSENMCLCNAEELYFPFGYFEHSQNDCFSVPIYDLIRQHTDDTSFYAMPYSLQYKNKNSPLVLNDHQDYIEAYHNKEIDLITSYNIDEKDLNYILGLLELFHFPKELPVTKGLPYTSDINHKDGAKYVFPGGELHYKKGTIF